MHGELVLHGQDLHRIVTTHQVDQNCCVVAMAAPAAVLWKVLWGEMSQYSVSLLMPSRN